MSRRLLICVFALALAGCTADPPTPPPPPPPDSGAMQLVAFDSCEQLFADVRRAAKAAVGPYGLPGNQVMRAEAAMEGGARNMADAAGAPAAAQAAAPAFSGTNVHEQGADEPDLIKTDGRRIVTVLGGDLRVIDPATRQETGRVDLGIGWAGDLQLLLSGDSALVLASGGHSRGRAMLDSPIDTPEMSAPQVLLVDLTGAPKVVSRYRGEGQLVDARMTGSTARVVLRSTARIDFPSSEPDIATNRKAIDRAPDSAWLPRWEVTDAAGGTTKGQTDCGRVSRPTDYSGGTMVSVLTFDLTRPALGSGDPVTVLADGDTVYATPDSLYLANNNRWRWDLSPGGPGRRVLPKTELYKFALTGNQPPVYRSSGAVAGYLLNQYAMSEWDGHLRVATTDETTNDSAVRVLADRDGKLVQTGIADGLGQDERIYSVRFVGARGYVVTFRQTDPLYSLDLRDPAQPKITGELKITGYSAHLQPVGEDRLVGIGQEANGEGRTQGLQVSLFDVADPANPKRLSQYHLPGAYSNAEYDPHGLLWWPATKLLVVPVESQGTLALGVTDDLTLTGKFGQPGTLRSLVIGNELWTMSKTGLTAFDLSTLDQRGSVPISF
jgi:uncharacterized secreted protein with C-terminal beta-propeller domain